MLMFRFFIVVICVLKLISVLLIIQWLMLVIRLKCLVVGMKVFGGVIWLFGLYSCSSSLQCWLLLWWGLIGMIFCVCNWKWLFFRVLCSLLVRSMLWCWCFIFLWLNWYIEIWLCLVCLVVQQVMLVWFISLLVLCEVVVRVVILMFVFMLQSCFFQGKCIEQICSMSLFVICFVFVRL